MHFKQACVILCLMVSAAGAGCAAPVLPAPPTHPNGQALWWIVSGCLADLRDRHDPAPCSELSVSDGAEHGYAVLKDIKGASQYLVMPTVRITGIEDPRLLSPGATNYFTPAWRVRQLVATALHTTLPRGDVGIAVNSLYGRSQDLLHLHVDCLSADTISTLRRAVPGIGNRWRRRLVLHGHAYRAVRIDGDDAVAQDPFRLLASGLRVPPAQMGEWTLVLAGMEFPDSKPGFVLLAARADPAIGFSGSGEELLDHACAIIGEHG